MASKSKKPGRYHDPWPWRGYGRLAEAVDRRLGWWRLPKVLGLVILIGLRDVLRRKNLLDTTGEPSIELPPLDPPPENTAARTVDGSYNDLDQPRMGMAGARFGRNVPIERTCPEPMPGILEPSPREVSRALMTRRELLPATSVNALVAPWLQFMIRDWFSHGSGPREDPWRIELADDDPWPIRPMTIPRTRPDPSRPPGATKPPTYVNTNSHWWDASQVYGTTPSYQQFVRSGVDGKLRVEADGSLPLPPVEAGKPTTEPGFWIGLAMLQILFTREHNAICDMLRGVHADWSDEQIFQRARLVLAAVIAKIHTVEWTPAVISHPTTVTAMHANWWGLAGQRINRAFGRISSSEVISGIPGSATQHYGVPYALTEEFVAVYRMHPLMPDDWEFHALADDRQLGHYTLRQLSSPDALKILADTGLSNLFYSFGVAHPGLVTLHNYPRDLQEFHRPDGIVVDLAAIDIMRDRELGVPRYAEFRRLLHLPAPKSFDDLTDDKALAQKIARLYDGDIERVDLMVGLFAEQRPPGFAFSDTAFRIFILMASRRLNSDRFFTRDFTPAAYTQEGLDWIADATMATVLLRHHPELRPVLNPAANAFHPWPRATA